jgi:hypothetical protein
MNQALLHAVLYYSSMFGVDPRLAQSVIKAESNWQVDAVGLANEQGLMQLHPKYFKGDIQDPFVNIKMGIKYLATTKKLCKHRMDFTYLVCYNQGISGGSLVMNPKQDKYYQRVMKEYRKLK